VAGTARYEGRLHYARESLGERLLRDELLNGEIFYTLREAQVLIEQWRVHYNTIRPHSALGYRPPAPEIIVSGKELPMNHEAA
jgi:transposase InsO family protein